MKRHRTFIRSGNLNYGVEGGRGKKPAEGTGRKAIKRRRGVVQE